MIEIHQRVNTPFGSGIVIGTSGDQVLVKYFSGAIRWEYRYYVKFVMSLGELK
jgi:hypothetical protein